MFFRFGDVAAPPVFRSAGPGAYRLAPIAGFMVGLIDRAVPLIIRCCRPDKQRDVEHRRNLLRLELGSISNIHGWWKLVILRFHYEPSRE